MAKGTEALAVAQVAADVAFDEYLRTTGAGATLYIPEIVIKEARAAYRNAGGPGQIDVCGHGNRTHPVCSVEVVRHSCK